MLKNFRVFISKRMKTTQNNIMTVMSWSKRNRLLACGYKNGEVILNIINESRSQPGTLQATTSQTLSHHKQMITAIEWSDDGSLLLTGDKSGKIVFWACPHKMWKNKQAISSVSSQINYIKWNRKSKMIAVAFQDGSFVYSYPNSEAKWSIQIRQPIEYIEFSSNGQYLLCGSSFGEIIILNENGVEIGTVPLPCLSQSNTEPKIAALEYNPRSTYGLLVAFKGGQIQLMRNYFDSQPIAIKVEAEITSASWFKSGSSFAVCASKENNKNSVIFFDNQGNALRELDVSGSKINSIATNMGDTQIALCSGDTFCLAQVLPTFLCAYTKNTLLYGFDNSLSSNYTLVYFNHVLRQKRVHSVENVLNVSGNNGFFAIFSKDPKDINNSCIISITDTIGVSISTAIISFIPNYFAIYEDTVACANRSTIAVWSFQNETEPLVKDFKISAENTKDTKKKDAYDDDSSSDSDDEEKGKNEEIKKETTNDLNLYISAICLFQTTLIVGFPNGLFLLDSKSLNELKRAKLGITPKIIQSSCDLKRLAIVDNTGLLQFFNVPTSRVVGPAKKDISNVMWSSKVPSYIAASEKQKLTIYDNMISYDTIQTLSNIIDFDEIEILTVDMMQIMQNPLEPEKKYFKTYPTKLLKNLKKMLADRPAVTLEAVMDFVKQQNNPRLWDELAQILLGENNLSMAEKCYLENMNYKGLQFIKRARAMKDPQLQRAQILSYFGRFDDAQTIYESIDRTDLSVEMRSLIGDYQMVINILGASSSDESASKAYENLGDMYVENHDWKSAAQAFQKSKNKVKLALSLFITDDFDGLSKLLKKQSSRSQILPFLGRLFLALGASEEAANAFQTSGDIQSAVECSIRLNNWKRAIDLVSNFSNNEPSTGVSTITAQKRSMQNEIRTKMLDYTNRLIENGQISTAVDFFTQAGLSVEAAKLLIREGDKILQKRPLSKDLINAKRCFIFAGLQLIEHIKSEQSVSNEDNNSTIINRGDMNSTISGSPKKVSTTSFLDNFLSNNLAESTNLLEEAWRKAEGVHFYLLSHRLLTQKKPKEALLCAIRVFESYSDIIDEDQSAALLAICGMKTGFMQQCSKAFTTLEFSDNFKPEAREKFQNLAIDIFTKRKPIDPDPRQLHHNQDEVNAKFCPKCQAEVEETCCQCTKCGFKLNFCVASGLLITDEMRWQCQYCRHCVSFETVIDRMPVCPFCHQIVTS